MAITPIRTFRWDDANAPVITNFRDWTQIKAWFQAIFVDGYLEDDNATQKPGLGWTLTFDDANYKIDIDMVENDILKPKPKIQFNYSNVIGTTAPNNNYRRPHFIVYENGTTNLLYDSGTTNVYGCNFIGLNDESGTKITQWIVVGNEKAFHVFTGYNDLIDGSSGIKPVEFTTSSKNAKIGWAFFGRIINDGVSLGDYSFIAKESVLRYDYTTDTYLQWAFYGYSSSNSYSYFKTSRDLSLNPVSYNILEENWFKWDHRYLSKTISQSLRYPYIDGGLYLKDFLLFQETDDIYLGRLPGAYVSEQSLPLKPASGLQEFIGDGIYADEKFLCFYNGVSSVFINTDRSWDI